MNERLMQQLFPNVNKKKWGQLTSEQIRSALDGYISRNSGKRLDTKGLGLLDEARSALKDLHDLTPPGGYGLDYLGVGSRKMARDPAKRFFKKEIGIGPGNSPDGLNAGGFFHGEQKG